MKIKHLIVLTIVFFLGIAKVDAQVIFTGGIEWGYTATIFNYHSFNYLTTDGVRVDDTNSEFDYKSNGAIIAHMGVYLGKHIGLTANSGWMGIYEGRRTFPLTLRATYYFNGAMDNGLNTFLDGGMALPIGQGSFKGKKLYTGKAGLGYRIPVFEQFCIDLNLALQYASDHPLNVIDRYTHSHVPQENLRRSNGNYFAATFTVGLSF